MTLLGVRLYAGSVLFGALVVGSPAPAFAQDALEFTLDEVEAAGKPEAKQESEATKVPPIAHALGELRWGMNKNELLGLLKKRIRTEYTRRLKAEKDVVRQDALQREANEAFLRIKDGVVTFDGRKSGWDASAVAEEFTHGSGESMLVVDDPKARDLYFFFHDHLWKWYRELKPAAFGGGNFDDIAATLKEQFGKAREREEPRSENGAAYRMLSWTDQATRVSALWRGSETCLVFEARETLEHLASLREHAMPRGGQRSGVLKGIIMSSKDCEAWRDSH